MQRRRHVHACG